MGSISRTCSEILLLVCAAVKLHISLRWTWQRTTYHACCRGKQCSLWWSGHKGVAGSLLRGFIRVLAAFMPCQQSGIAVRRSCNFRIIHSVTASPLLFNCQTRHDTARTVVLPLGLGACFRQRWAISDKESAQSCHGGTALCYLVSFHLLTYIAEVQRRQPAAPATFLHSVGTPAMGGWEPALLLVIFMGWTFLIWQRRCLGFHPGEL